MLVENLLYLLCAKFNYMLLFLVPCYLILFFGWLIYAGLIKGNLKKHIQVAYVGGVFSLIWLVILVFSIT